MNMDPTGIEPASFVFSPQELDYILYLNLLLGIGALSISSSLSSIPPYHLQNLQSAYRVL